MDTTPTLQDLLVQSSETRADIKNIKESIASIQRSMQSRHETLQKHLIEASGNAAKQKELENTVRSLTEEVHRQAIADNTLDQKQAQLNEAIAHAQEISNRLIKTIEDKLTEQSALIDSKVDSQLTQMSGTITAMQTVIQDFKSTTALVHQLQTTIDECRRAIKYLWAAIVALLCLFTATLGANGFGELIGKFIGGMLGSGG